MGRGKENSVLEILHQVKKHPGRLTLGFISLLTLGQLISIGRQVVEGQSRVSTLSLPREDKDGSKLHEPQLRIDPYPSRHRIIIDYINNYLENDLGARTLEKFSKLWTVTTTEPVQIFVIEKEGLLIRDFPDPKLGRKTPTGGPGTGPTWKALYYDPINPVPGIFKDFIIVKDPKKQGKEGISIWAVRYSSEGSWPNIRQPHFETLLVYDEGRWYVSFMNEEDVSFNSTTSGERLFEQAYPAFIFPKEPKRITL